MDSGEPYSIRGSLSGWYKAPIKCSIWITRARIWIPFFPVPDCLFFGILRFPRISSDSGEHTSELNHSGARLMCSGILRNPESGRNPEGRTLESTAHCATCNKQKAGRLKNLEKAGVNDGILLLPCPAASAMPCYRAAVLPPLLPLLEQRQ